MTCKQKILIVDDRKENLVALRRILRGVDAEIVEATSGNEALAATLDHQFAVAILDVMMPDMNGYELAEHLRGDEKTRVIPIMFLTASYDDELHAFKGYEAGGVDYIVKPFVPEVLLSKVKVFLEIDRNRCELQMHRDHLEALVMERTHSLNERVKETGCLYAVSNLVAESWPSIDEAMRTAVDLIPPGWQYPDITRARIVFEGKEYRSDDFRETAWKQSADIVVSGEKCGAVEVYYLEEKPEGDEGPFLREERDLLIDIARQLGVLVQRERAHDALRNSELRYRAIFEGAAEGILAADIETKMFTYANPAICAMFGYTEEEMKRLGVLDMHPKESLGHVVAEFEAQARGEKSLTVGLPCLRKDGTVFRADIVTTSAVIDDKKCNIGFFTDTTERVQLEEQLRQAQKMETVGLLAGGIAHDFNNLLLVIMGQSELMLNRLSGDDPLRTGLEQIRSCGEKAAALTHQLLAFSRKQIMEPRVLDLNILVKDLSKMLHRLLGETIELNTVLSPDLSHVKVDPGQIEQVIMNLAVNARDAMPRGGALTIETTNVELDQDYADQHVSVVPGPYVMLAVSDTGIGMDEETKARIFEPFFTTKSRSEGTGLGLSTVFGIVKQCDGHINCYSELDRGTIFKVYLARVEEEVSEQPVVKKISELPRGSETVLVVEDDEGVKDLVSVKLESMGYHVLRAAEGVEARKVCSEYKAPIDLLVTDVILPGTNGMELAEALTATRPGLKVLFMSGYTENTIAHHGMLDKGIFFLQKPFTIQALVLKVRKVLDTG
jgi:PAS domain S-box-containing protein